MIQRKIHLPSREVTEDNEHRNKNQEEDQESCWETPLEAKAGVWKFKDQHLRFIPTRVRSKRCDRSAISLRFLLSLDKVLSLFCSVWKSGEGPNGILSLLPEVTWRATPSHRTIRGVTDKVYWQLPVGFSTPQPFLS